MLADNVRTLLASSSKNERIQRVLDCNDMLIRLAKAGIINLESNTPLPEEALKPKDFRNKQINFSF